MTTKNDTYDSTDPYCKNCKFARPIFNYRDDRYECDIVFPPYMRMPSVRNTEVRPHNTCSLHRYKENSNG